MYYKTEDFLELVGLFTKKSQHLKNLSITPESELYFFLPDFLAKI